MVLSTIRQYPNNIPGKFEADIPNIKKTSVILTHLLALGIHEILALYQH